MLRPSHRSFLLLLGTLVFIAPAVAAELRHVGSFNREWTFKLGDTRGDWSWADEIKRWNWPEREGRPMQIAVYLRREGVRLELPGRVIGETA